jgi:hypothetical protein
MANTILTPTAVTRESLRILHQKLNFVGTINRQYDDSYAVEGAKIGDSLKIRLPNEYTVRTGATLNAQDISETSVTLQVATQKGVDVNFTSKELTMDLDGFSKRILEPAMSVLAANIESDAMVMYKDVWNEVSDVGAAGTFADVLNVKKKLTDSLAPLGDRTFNLDTQSSVDIITDTKSLFQDSGQIAKQYKEGKLGRVAGFDFYENTLWPTHTTGSDDGTGDHKVNGANQTGASITHDSAGSGTLLTGDVISFAGCNRVHPETKADTGILMKFVVTSDMTATATTVAISPSIVTSGATQNVSASPTTTGAIWKRESDDSTAIGASADYLIGMAYHKDAFAFATADLLKPSGVDFCAREVMDGISMRIVRDYDINNDKLPCRIDVLYGYKTLRAPLACRLGLN